jgi:hypothetical protein
MSGEEAENLMDELERKWNAKHRHNLISRMEHKLSRKERSGRT